MHTANIKLADVLQQYRLLAKGLLVTSRGVTRRHAAVALCPFKHTARIHTPAGFSNS
jgi:hypothetical protein